MTIEEIQQELIGEFEFLGDWTERYDHLIALGKELQPLSDEEKSDDLLIRGCQSKVWLKAELKDGKVVFRADSDAIITKGIVALLVRVLSNQPPAEVAAVDLHFIQKIGLIEHLSPTRANGLVSMVKQMKYYGAAFHAASTHS